MIDVKSLGPKINWLLGYKNQCAEIANNKFNHWKLRQCLSSYWITKIWKHQNRESTNSPAFGGKSKLTAGTLLKLRNGSLTAGISQWQVKNSVCTSSIDGSEGLWRHLQYQIHSASHKFDLKETPQRVEEMNENGNALD